MSRVSRKDFSTLSYHYPMNATIVTVKSGDNTNCLAVAWHTSISINPPLYGVSISPQRYSHQLITEAEEFVVNFLPFSEVEKIAGVGGTSGKDTDKFQKFNISVVDPLIISSPVLEKAYAAYECTLYEDHRYGDHVWFVGEVVAVHYEEDYFDKTLKMDENKPALYMGADRYAEVNDYHVYHVSRKNLKKDRE